MKAYFRALNNALGVRRYLVGGVASAVAGAYQHAAQRLQELGLIDLGLPWWAIIILVYLLYITCFVVARLTLMEKRTRDARVQLGSLRADGVRMRNEASEASWTLEQWRIWEQQVLKWESDVVATIGEIDKAYAEWFRVLDTVSTPRIQPQNIPAGNLTKLYREHDCRLRRLGRMIYQLWKDLP